VSEQDRAIGNRLRRVHGQLGGAIRMLEEGRPCEYVVAQLMAVRTAVDRAAGEIVLAHIEECMTRLPPDQVKETVGRAVRLLGRITG
jgi:DNA-binding FrmR family transcriptional regulator